MWVNVFKMRVHERIIIFQNFSYICIWLDICIVERFLVILSLKVHQNSTDRHQYKYVWYTHGCLGAGFGWSVIVNEWVGEYLRPASVTLEHLINWMPTCSISRVTRAGVRMYASVRVYVCVCEIKAFCVRLGHWHGTESIWLIALMRNEATAHRMCGTKENVRNNKNNNSCNNDNHYNKQSKVLCQKLGKRTKCKMKQRTHTRQGCVWEGVLKKHWKSIKRQGTYVHWNEAAQSHTKVHQYHRIYTQAYRHQYSCKGSRVTYSDFQISLKCVLLQGIFFVRTLWFAQNCPAGISNRKGKTTGAWVIMKPKILLRKLVAFKIWQRHCKADISKL